MAEDQIPSVEIYVSDKWILLAHSIAGAAMVIAVAAEPKTPWMWVVLVCAVVGGAINPLLARLRPTPKQAGAMRFVGEANSQLSEFKVEQITKAVEQKAEAARIRRKVGL